MNIIPFQTINWDVIPKTEYPGETGNALVANRTARRSAHTHCYLQQGLPGRSLVQQRPCGTLPGSFVTELENGHTFRLSPGMSYVVSDELSSHRSVSEEGVKLLLVDGAFLEA